MGLLVGSGIGIVRTMHSNPNNRCDFTPVDVCAKAMIIAAWKRAHDKEDLMPVYNCASYGLSTVKIQQIVDIGRCLTEVVPFEKTIFKPGGHITSNRYANYVKLIILQLLPALIIDSILRIKGQKPLLVVNYVCFTFFSHGFFTHSMTKIQRKIYEANIALQYFVMNDWEFKNDNFIGLCEILKADDLKAFSFEDCFTFDVIHFIKICIVGVQKFLLMDNEENERFTRIKYQILNVVHKIFCSLFFILIYYIVVVKLDAVEILKNFVKF